MVEIEGEMVKVSLFMQRKLYNVIISINDVLLAPREKRGKGWRRSGKEDDVTQQAPLALSHGLYATRTFLLLFREIITISLPFHHLFTICFMIYSNLCINFIK